VRVDRKLLGYGLRRQSMQLLSGHVLSIPHGRGPRHRWVGRRSPVEKPHGRSFQAPMPRGRARASV
jgi:hypothetical protein